MSPYAPQKNHTSDHLPVLSMWICCYLIPPRKIAAILAEYIFKCISLNENDKIPIQISLKFVRSNESS